MLKIGDFSRLSRVSVKALRYYDEIGLLKPVEVDRFTGYRYYSADQFAPTESNSGSERPRPVTCGGLSALG